MTQIHRFEHPAMKTTFCLRLIDSDVRRVHEVAHLTMRLLDELEAKLSRYRAGSDVWQINHMETGQTLFLSEESDACLRLAAEAHEQTGGLFDSTLGTLVEHRKNNLEGRARPLAGTLRLAPDRPAITCEEAGREIDLGGIGKGFALDRIKALMQEWEIEAGLLSAGASTQLAFGPQTWPIELSGDDDKKTIPLCNQALSASGSGIQGSHIVSPFADTGPHNRFKRVWILHPSAALADAWSTALMLADLEQIRSFSAPPESVFFETPTGLHSLAEMQQDRPGLGAAR